MGIDALIDKILPKSRIKPKSIEQLMLPMTISGWIVGMGIVEYPLGNRWPVTSFIYTLVLISGYSFLAKEAMSNIDVLVTSSSVSGIIVFKALFYSNVCLNICGTVLGWMRIRSVKNIVNRLEASDKKIEKMGIPRDYSIIYFRQVMALVFQFFLVFVLMLLAYNWSTLSKATGWEKIVGAVAAYYPVIITSVGDLSFVTLVRFITLRFNQLNKCLLAMSTTTDDSPQHKRVLQYTRSKLCDDDHVFEKSTNDDSSAMRAARRYHHELIKIAHMINDTFGVQALLSMSVSFGLITGLLYRNCSMILNSNMSEEILNEELMNAVCWLAFYVYRIFLINSACAKATNVAQKTGNIICHLHEPSTKKAYRDEIRDFTLQMTQHSVTFTACGFFTLNYGLIQGMIGSITTYLVILLQMGDLKQPQALANETLSSGSYSTEQSE